MEIFRKISPVEYYQNFLDSGIRPDGRKVAQHRKVSASAGSINSVYGSSFTKIGNTSIICGIRGQVGVIKELGAGLSEIDKEHLAINLEILSLGPQEMQNENSAECSRVTGLDLTFICQKMINLDNLIVKKSENPSNVEFGWYLFADLYCLEHDGNILDACLIALLTALKNVRLPLIFMKPNGEVCMKSEGSLDIKFNFIPISTSFAIYKDFVLTDPNYDEEFLSDGSLHIVYDENENLRSLARCGGEKMSETALSDCLEKSKTRTKEIIDKIIKAQ